MYQVWTKGDEYSGWAKTDCPDLEAALALLLNSIKAGKEPLLTVEVPYEVGVKIKSSPAEDKISPREKHQIGIEDSKKEEKVEAKKGETEPDKGAGGKSHSKV